MKTTFTQWLKDNVPGDAMIWAGAAGAQFAFVRDNLTQLVGQGLYWRGHPEICTVVETHIVDPSRLPDIVAAVVGEQRSKSITLPVYMFERKDLGLRLILRDNFLNWKLSVESKRPVEADFAGLFHTNPPVDRDYTGDEPHEAYFEGFPAKYIYGYYELDKRRWSACIHGYHTLWTTVFLIMRAAGAVKPCVWHTPKSHEAEMARESAQDAEWRRHHGKE